MLVLKLSVIQSLLTPNNMIIKGEDASKDDLEKILDQDTDICK